MSANILAPSRHSSLRFVWRPTCGKAAKPGLALLSSGDFRRAAHELETASRLKPSDARVLLPLGVALSNLGQQEAAADVFKTILKQDAQSLPALDGLTKALIAEGRYAAAIALLKNAPADEALRLNLAIAYSKNGNTEQAIQILWRP